MKISTKFFNDPKEYFKTCRDLPDGWIYLGDDEERYVLGQPGRRNVLTFGVNPSTAVPGRDDPTIRRVRKRVLDQGYDGWIMVNLYPLIASKPKELPESCDRTLFRQNLRVIGAIQEAYPIAMAWAAWGDAIDLRPYLGEALWEYHQLAEADFEFYCCGTRTANGNPRHPLYLKGSEEFDWFAAYDYACSWSDLA